MQQVSKWSFAPVQFVVPQALGFKVSGEIGTPPQWFTGPEVSSFSGTDVVCHCGGVNIRLVGPACQLVDLLRDEHIANIRAAQVPLDHIVALALEEAGHSLYQYPIPQRSAARSNKSPVKRIRAPGDRVGGHVICRHKIRRNLCEECGGGGICEHHIQRHWCRQCGGPNKVRCVHGHQKSKCREGCGGSAFCQHNQYKYRCRECKAKQ
jgi:hypothetical protein